MANTNTTPIGQLLFSKRLDIEKTIDLFKNREASAYGFNKEDDTSLINSVFFEEFLDHLKKTADEFLYHVRDETLIRIDIKLLNLKGEVDRIYLRELFNSIIERVQQDEFREISIVNSFPWFPTEKYQSQYGFRTTPISSELQKIDDNSINFFLQIIEEFHKWSLKEKQKTIEEIEKKVDDFETQQSALDATSDFSQAPPQRKIDNATVVSNNTDSSSNTTTDSLISEQPLSDTRISLSRIDEGFLANKILTQLLVAYQVDAKDIEEAFSLISPDLNAALKVEIASVFTSKNIDIKQFLDADGHLSETKLKSYILPKVAALGGFIETVNNIQQWASKANKTNVQEKISTVSTQTLINIAPDEETLSSGAQEYSKRNADEFKDEMRRLAVQGILQANADQIIEEVFKNTSKRNFSTVDTFALKEILSPDTIALLNTLTPVEQQRFLNNIQSYLKKESGIKATALTSKQIQEIERTKSLTGQQLVEEIFKNKKIDGAEAIRIQRILEAYALSPGEASSFQNWYDSVLKAVQNSNNTELQGLFKEFSEESFLKLSDTEYRDSIQSVIEKYRDEYAIATNNETARESNYTYSDDELLPVIVYNHQLLQGFSAKTLALAKYSDNDQLSQLQNDELLELQSLNDFLASNQLPYFNPNDYQNNSTESIQTAINMPLSQLSQARNKVSHLKKLAARKKAEKAIAGNALKFLVPAVTGLGIGGLVGGALAQYGSVASTLGGAVAGGLTGAITGAGLGALTFTPFGIGAGAVWGFISGATTGAAGGAIGFEILKNSVTTANIGGFASSFGVTDGALAAKQAAASVIKSGGGFGGSVLNGSGLALQALTPGTAGFGGSGSSLSLTAMSSVTGTFITGTVASVLAVSTILTAFLPEVDNSFVGSFSTDIVESKYVKVEKIPSVREAENPEAITYTIRISKKTDDPEVAGSTIKISDILDTPSVAKKEGEAPVPQLPDSLATDIQQYIGEELVDPIQIEFTVDTSSTDYQDSLVKNDLKVSFIVDDPKTSTTFPEDANARAQTCFGDCPQTVIPACWPTKGSVWQPPCARGTLANPIYNSNALYSHKSDTVCLDAYDVGSGATSIFQNPIYAVAPGTVIFADWDPSTVNNSNSGYGLLVKIDHGSFITYYAHNNKLYVENGDTVVGGQKIGEVGDNGFSSGPHLHFEIRGLSEYVLQDLYGISGTGVPTNGPQCDEYYGTDN